MTGFGLGKRDEERLRGVHPDLVSVVRAAAALSTRRFMVIEGLRTAARQRELYDKGASRTMNSRHLTGHAVDLAPLLDDGSIPWNRWDYFDAMARTVKRAALTVGIEITWGGDWTRFRDGPHFELPRAKYR